MVTKQEITRILKGCKDPEINIDLLTLGLIRKIEINKNKVKIIMTFTTPFCPYGPQMIEELKSKIKAKGVKKVEIGVTFNPPWEMPKNLKKAFGT
jgi:metal-sulfur cluster biosynthetic enzyme